MTAAPVESQPPRPPGFGSRAGERRPVCLLLYGAFFFLLSVTGMARTPGWLEEALLRSDPILEEGQDAVVLHDEVFWDYGKRGRIEVTIRRAVKVLEDEGRTAAIFVAGYDSSADKVHSLEGWVLHPEARPFRFRQRDCADVADSMEQLYNEYRTIRYSAVAEARRGSVFAYEYKIGRRSLFADRVWQLNEDYPVLHSRVEAQAPQGWEFRYALTNEDVDVKVHTERDRMIWSARNIPAFVGEEGRSSGMYRTRLRLTVMPGSDDARSYPLLSWNSWPAVAAYVSEICERPSRPAASVTAKALELTAGLTHDAERIQAIAAYVQQTRYVSLMVDLGKGGGFTPHDAEDVLRANYGDCKDKVNLMRVLLAAVGIESYPVIVLAANGRWVNPDWPSPSQFNHAIIGIRTGAQPEWESLVQDERLGSVLFFDPTHEDVVVGHLPYTIQGTRALLGYHGSELITLPRSHPENHLRHDELEVVLHPNGDIEGLARLDRTGLLAGGWRRTKRLTSPGEFEKRVTRAMGANMRNVATGGVLFEDDRIRGALSLSTSFASLGYARSMRGRILVLDPDFMGRNEWIPAEDENRRTSIRIEPSTHRTRNSIILPMNFKVDELPPTVTIETPWADFRLHVSVEEHILTYEREEIWKQALVPAEEYEAYREYLRSVRNACAMPVVLVKI